MRERALKACRPAPITRGVSLETTLARVAEINRALSFQPTQNRAGAPARADFAKVLDQVGGAQETLRAAAPVGAGGAGGILGAARGELGVTEQPPGSNESPRIKTYREATAGAPGPGPWCAYFVSWCARQAGNPIGPNGSGFGSVDAVWSWAQGEGRTSQTPRPGDLVVWDEHIGIVEAVLPDGRIQTIEGNTTHSVARRTHSADGIVGYVRMS